MRTVHDTSKACQGIACQRDEHAQWLEHIAHWRAANHDALDLMTCLRKRIVEHGEDLVVHEHAVVAHEQLLERLVSGPAAEGLEFGLEHSSESDVPDTHGTERERHDELGRTQNHLETLIERLKEVLSACH
jgi:hypothetical protein